MFKTRILRQKPGKGNAQVAETPVVITTAQCAMLITHDAKNYKGIYCIKVKFHIK